MTITFDNERVAQFLAIPFEYQLFASAKAPQVWVLSVGLEGVDFAATLPAAAQTREEVRRLCRNEEFPLLYRYICAMAWGSQGGGARSRNARWAWAERERLELLLAAIVAGNIDRAQAYALFCGSGAIKGLGPAYFTKLLYFFWPDERCYIMDQWTARSVNYLTGEKMVRMSGNYVASNNDGKRYERYCQAVESLADSTGPEKRLSGAETEMRLFCRGGKPAGRWRTIIRAHVR